MRAVMVLGSTDLVDTSLVNGSRTSPLGLEDPQLTVQLAQQIEGAMLSEGRGTTRPFELVGAPWIDGDRFDGRGSDVDAEHEVIAGEMRV